VPICHIIVTYNRLLLQAIVRLKMPTNGLLAAILAVYLIHSSRMTTTLKPALNCMIFTNFFVTSHRLTLPSTTHYIFKTYTASAALHACELYIEARTGRAGRVGPGMSIESNGSGRDMGRPRAGMGQMIDGPVRKKQARSQL
jgi:hypothetical protein